MCPSDGRVVSNFIVQALNGEPLTVFGDGQQTRSFCYVDDLITGMILMMNIDEDITGPINLGNPVEFTILELAETILGLIGGKSKINFKPLPSDDPKQRQPNISEAKSVLGWEAKVPLGEGLKPTIAYFRQLLAK